MIDVQFLTIAEMNSAIARQEADLAKVEAAMYKNLTALSSSAQAKRLVAMNLTKHARSLLADATSTVPCLKLKETPADARTASSDEADTLAQTTMPDEPVELVSGIAESLADTLGVKEEALAPFLVESISTALAYCGAMIDLAEKKLAEADDIEATAELG